MLRGHTHDRSTCEEPFHCLHRTRRAHRCRGALLRQPERGHCPCQLEHGHRGARGLERAPPTPATAQKETAAPEDQEPVVGPPQVAWKDMTKQQRGKYMARVVMPRMKEVFHAFDDKKFAKVTCATCHGPGAKDRSFTMPNPENFVLPAPADFGSLMQEKPEWVKFMAEKVKPEMATLLGLKEFDPQNPQPGTFKLPQLPHGQGALT